MLLGELALLISRAPMTKLATSAFCVLQRAYLLFGKAAEILPFSSSVLVSARVYYVRVRCSPITMQEARYAEARRELATHSRGSACCQQLYRRAILTGVATADAVARQRTSAACTCRRGDLDECAAAMGYEPPHNLSCGT